MKKYLLIIGAVILASVTWLFSAKPQPPFGANPTPVVVSQEPTYFAEIDENGIVLRVIVISQENINTGKWGDPSRWVQTSMDGSIRKNPAGKGYKYDSVKDAFIPQRPKNAIGFDDIKAKWILPTPTPFIKLSPIASQ